MVEICPGVSVEIRENPWQVFHRTSKLTIAPPNTFCPAAGTCATMMLAGEGCGGAGGSTGVEAAEPGAAVEFDVSSGGLAGITTFTFPNLNPSSCKPRLALPSGCPTKLGITNACGSIAAVTSKLIFGAVTWASFAVGLCANT